MSLLSHETTSVSGAEGDLARVTAQLVVDGKHETVQGEGNGPIDAFVHGLPRCSVSELDVVDYSEHAVDAGADHAGRRVCRDRVARRSDTLGCRHGFEHPHCVVEGSGEHGQRPAVAGPAVDGSHAGRLASYPAMSST